MDSEAVRAEVRRADEAGEPHTGATLADAFGMSEAWAYERLADFRKQEGAPPGRAGRKPTVDLEAVWAALRRAEAAGEPHTAATLATAFGKGKSWAKERLAEFRAREGDTAQAASARTKQGADSEDVWAEVRRAEASGTPHNGATLAKAFGKSKSWGYERLAEFKRRDGNTTEAQPVVTERDVDLAAVWAEVRRADEAGEPHTGRSLAGAFGMDVRWGADRVAEFRAREGGVAWSEVAKRRQQAGWRRCGRRCVVRATRVSPTPARRWGEYSEKASRGAKSGFWI